MTIKEPAEVKRLRMIGGRAYFMESRTFGNEFFTISRCPREVKDISGMDETREIVANALHTYPTVDLGCGSTLAIDDTLASIETFVGERTQQYIGVDLLALQVWNGITSPLQPTDFHLSETMRFLDFDGIQREAKRAEDVTARARIVEERFRNDPLLHFNQNDILLALSDLPDASVNVMLMGFEHGVIITSPDFEYQNEIAKQLRRVLAPCGVFIEKGSDYDFTRVSDHCKGWDGFTFAYNDRPGEATPIDIDHFCGRDVFPLADIWPGKSRYIIRQMRAAAGEDVTQLTCALAPYFIPEKGTKPEHAVEKMRALYTAAEGRDIAELAGRFGRLGQVSIGVARDFVRMCTLKPQHVDAILTYTDLRESSAIVHRMHKEVALDLNVLQERAAVHEALAKMGGGLSYLGRLDTEELLPYLATLQENAGKTIGELPRGLGSRVDYLTDKYRCDELDDFLPY